MKYAIAIPCLMIVVGLAQAREHCADKEAAIGSQLEQAREQGNDGRIRGLETALRNVRAHCTDAGLQADRQKAIDDARDEVAEREVDLQDALREGSDEKIEKR